MLGNPGGVSGMLGPLRDLGGEVHAGQGNLCKADGVDEGTQLGKGGSRR